MRFVARFVDLILPPLCLGCEEPVGSDAFLCTECWKKIQFITPPLCAACGAPFDFKVEEGSLCGACAAELPLYGKARAAMIYDDGSKGIVLGFKHGDRTHAAMALATWMQLAGAEVLKDADVLMPVPLHRWRLFHRRYNQSALLAKALSALTGKSVLFDALKRIRHTPIQGKMKRKERQENVRGAFKVVKPSAIQNKAIVLIDDVMTTGATVQECAKVLSKAGAQRVDVLTLSRVKSMV